MEYKKIKIPKQKLPGRLKQRPGRTGAFMAENEFFQLRKKIIEKDFASLNDMQKQAVFTTRGPLLILAGAGSGKTTVLVNRIANIIKYGDAYNSETIPFKIEQNDIASMNAFYSGDNEEYSKIKDFLSDGAAKPWQILAITFTNKAAGELKERLENMLGLEANDIWAKTFHSACLRILRRNGERLGYSSHFTIYDTDDQRRTMKDVQKNLRIEDKILSHKSILNEISKAKDSLISPEEYIKNNSGDVRLKTIGEAYKKYQQTLLSADAMDFDDIIINTVRLLEENPDILEYYSNLFKYILVDEYQDTNHAQYRLIALLAQKHKNICVVGDDDQSIYRFRGATVENILSFEKQYPEAKVIRLEQNYRSTQNILDAANAVIANNTARKGKNLWTANGSGELITLNTSPDEQQEGAYIAECIADSVGSGSKWRDHAVLYRKNAQSNAIERAFVKAGVPYRVLGGHRFYERKEIRDAIAYLHVIDNPDDDVRLKRIINEPKRGIGNTTVDNAAQIALNLGLSLYEVIKNADEYEKLSRSANKLRDFCGIIDDCIAKAQGDSLKELFDFTMDRTGYIEYLKLDKETYKERIENIRELSSNLVKYDEENPEGGLSGFLEETTLMSDIDNYDGEADCVVLMTLHSAKGLEFPVVFIPGMEEDIFPGLQSFYNPEEVEEERRLAYVGITRAKRQLFFTNASMRMLYGTTTRSIPSRFIGEIPSVLIKSDKNPINRSGEFSSVPYKNRSGGFLEPSGYRTERTGGNNPKNAVFSSGFSQSVAKADTPVPHFIVGDAVTHKAFGDGVVISAQAMGNDILLEVAFNAAGTKKLMAKYSKLTKK